MPLPVGVTFRLRAKGRALRSALTGRDSRQSEFLLTPNVRSPGTQWLGSPEAPTSTLQATASTHPATGNQRPARRAEAKTPRRAYTAGFLSSDLPRHAMLNVVKGGTLIQHLTTSINNTQKSAPRRTQPTPAAHPIDVLPAPDCRDHWCGAPRRHSRHHQAIATLGTGLSPPQPR